MGNMIEICHILGMEKRCRNQRRMDAMSSSLSRSRVRASTVANITIIDETRERNIAVLAGTSGVGAKAGAGSARSVGSGRKATAAGFLSFILDIRGIKSVSINGSMRAKTAALTRIVSTGQGVVGSSETGRISGSGAAVDSDSTMMGMVAAGSAGVTRSKVNLAGTAQLWQRSKSQVLQLVPVEMTASHMSQACSRLKVRNLHICPAGHTVPLKLSSAML